MPVKTFARKKVKLSTLPKKKLSKKARRGRKRKKGRSATTLRTKKEKKKKPVEANTDQLSIEQESEYFLEASGICKQRAEILMNLGFLPVYDSTGKNKIAAMEDLFETQKNLRGLYYDNNNALLEKMAEDGDLEDEVAKALALTTAQMETSVEEISLLGDIRSKVNMIKKDLDLKMSGPDIVDQINKRGIVAYEKRKEELESSIEAAAAKAGAADTSRADAAKSRFAKFEANRDLSELSFSIIENFHDIWVDTGFTEASYRNFSNTKLLAQLIQDMRATLETNSPMLISDVRERKKDSHPFAVHDSPYSGRKKGEAFSMEEFSGPEHTATYATYTDIMSKVPTAQAPRMKILFNALAKEARHSLASVDGDVMSMVEELASSSGTDIFSEIFGTPSGFLSDTTLPKGLSEILKGEVGSESVLPFEPAYVFASDSENVLLPGTIAFADSILTSGNLNHGPLMQYAQAYIETVGATRAAIDGIDNIGFLPRGSFGAHEPFGRNFKFKGTGFFSTVAQKVSFFASKVKKMTTVEPAQTWGEFGAFAFFVDKSSSSPKLRFALYKYATVLQRAVILKEQETLAEVLGANEEASAELEKQEIMSKMTNPYFQSAALKSKLSALMAEETESDEASPLDTDPLSLETSADALAVLGEIGDILIEEGFSKGGSTPDTTGWTFRPSTPSSSASKPSGGSASKRSQEEWHQTDSHVIKTLTLKASMDDTESKFNRYFLQTFGVGERIKRLGKSYRKGGMLLKNWSNPLQAQERNLKKLQQGLRKTTARANRGAARSAAIEKAGKKAFKKSGGKKYKKTQKQLAANNASLKRQAEMQRKGIQNREAQLAAASAAAKRSAILKIDDYFESNEESGTRTSLFNGINEDVYDMVMFDAVITLISYIIDLKVTKSTTSYISAAGISDTIVNFSVNATRARAAHYALQKTYGYNRQADDYEETIEDVELELYTDILSGLFDIKESLAGEGRFLKRAWTVLDAIGDMLVQRSMVTHSYFNIAANSTPHQSLMKRLLDDTSGDGGLVLASLTKEQLALKHYAVENFGELPKDSGKCPFPSHKMISGQELLLLDAVIKSRGFRSGRASNLNVIAVGLPAGLMQHLSIESFADSAAFQRYDPYDKNKIVKIKVYKRDVQFDDIVFKPITFYFDPSRYLSPVDSYSDIIPGDKLSDMTKKLKFIGYTSTGREEPDGLLYSDLLATEDFQVLTRPLRAKAVTNMINSEALKTYIKVITGIDLNEQAFPLNPAGTLFFSGEATEGANLMTDLFVEQEEIDTEEGLLQEQARLAQLQHFGKSTIFQGSALRGEAMSPVLFERIYCLPVDPDDFVINIRKTFSTTAGKKAFRSAFRMRKIRRIRGKSKRVKGRTRVTYKYKMKPRRKNEGSVSIFEYFVSVEVLKSKLSDRSTDAAEKMVAETTPPESYSYEPED